MNNDLIRITSNYFCAGAELHPINGICLETAPILKYMKNKNFNWIKSYCNKKNWKLELLSSVKYEWKIV